MSEDENNYYEGTFEVNILFKSGESVNFNCGAFRIEDPTKFLYEFDELSDDDGTIVHYNYSHHDVVSILINDVGEGDDEEEEEED